MSRERDLQDPAARRARHAPRAPAAVSEESSPVSPVADLEALQRAAGNAAVRSLLDVELRPPESDDVASPPPALRRSVEAQLGVDLGDVRVHTGPASDVYVRRLGALAATVGRDVYIADQPTDDKQAGRLLKHELTHAAQSSSTPGKPISISDPASPAERQARAVASADPSTVHATPSVAPAATVHRAVTIDEEEVAAQTAGGAAAAAPGPAAETPISGQPPAAPAPAPPTPTTAVSAMFQAAVLQPLEEARKAILATPPNAAAAREQVGGARTVLKALAGTYRTSNPTLYAQLWMWITAMTTVNTKLAQMMGQRATPAEIGGEIDIVAGGLRDRIADLG